jgi:hypothetical protein
MVEKDDPDPAREVRRSITAVMSALLPVEALR